MPAAGRQPVDVPGVHVVAGQRPALPGHRAIRVAREGPDNAGRSGDLPALLYRWNSRERGQRQSGAPPGPATWPKAREDGHRIDPAGLLCGQACPERVTTHLHIREVGPKAQNEIGRTL
ncbi:hypothetical protein D5301_20845 [Stenotrophomonas sp. MH181796]|nr:hypothetical protein [Stenotrophomonas sp. MH181796]